MPPVTGSPEGNSGSNSSLTTDNKPWVDHQSKKYRARFASTEPELKQNKRLLSFLIKLYILFSKKVTKAEQDRGWTSLTDVKMERRNSILNQTKKCPECVFHAFHTWVLLWIDNNRELRGRQLKLLPCPLALSSVWCVL